MASQARARRQYGPAWPAAPLVVCLPCLAPFIAGAVLTGAGAGAAGSSIVHNGVLLAAGVSLATTVAIVIGLSVVRFQERRRYANKHW